MRVPDGKQTRTSDAGMFDYIHVQSKVQTPPGTINGSIVLASSHKRPANYHINDKAP